MNSLFAFNFQFIPWEACLNLGVSGVKLTNGFSMTCTRDRLTILWQGNPTQFETALSGAHILARAFIHAEAFFSFPNGLVLEVEPLTWLEARDSSPKKIVSGYMHESLRNLPLNPNQADQDRLRAAAGLVVEVDHWPALQLALADFHAARRERPPYSAFYAFRVLEDIGYHFGIRKDEKPNWRAMNQALGTSEADWKPLTDAGTMARHLNILNLSKLNTTDLGTLLNLAHEAVEKTVRHERQKAAVGEPG